MSEERLKEIKKMVKEKGLKIYCSDFTKSEIEYIISETVLSKDDEYFARMKYIEALSNSEIADKLGLSIDAVKYHRRKVSLLLRQTCCRIFL